MWRIFLQSTKGLKIAPKCLSAYTFSVLPSIIKKKIFESKSKLSCWIYCKLHFVDTFSTCHLSSVSIFNNTICMPYLCSWLVTGFRTDLNLRKIAIWLSKNEHFCQFFWKKCQVFGNFLTFKWQFSGESASDIRPCWAGRNRKCLNICSVSYSNFNTYKIILWFVITKTYYLQNIALFNLKKKCHCFPSYQIIFYLCNMKWFIFTWRTWVLLQGISIHETNRKYNESVVQTMHCIRLEMVLFIVLLW